MTESPELSDYTPVTEFYHDSSVFITGGTGFLGKVLVEKLLWSCPGIKNIYLLMRPKRGKDVATRLTDLISSPIFNRVRTLRPLEMLKIVPIVGDVAEPELGINKSDQKLLIETVSVVFHAAATVKFNEALKQAIAINMMGTKKLVELCHRMLKLKALIHVSTAYCNCDQQEVKEIIYPAPYDPHYIMQCMEWMDDVLIEAMTPTLIGNRPNTYTFTKALAESMLLKESASLPVAIVRPSIVLSSWREPIPGWVDGGTGPTGLIAAGGMGLFRTVYCHGDMVADMVPVDMVVNLLICVAWRTARQQPKSIAVYNCATGQQKPLMWKDFVRLCYHFMRKHPLTNAIWYPDAKCRSNWACNMLHVFILHFSRAYVMDFFTRLSGKRPKFVDFHTKLRQGSKVLEFFTTHQWDFKDDNVRDLLNDLNTDDRCTFHFNTQDINWPYLLESYALGIRKYYFNQHPSSLPLARRRMKMLYWIHHTTRIVGVILLLRLFLIVFSYVLSF